MCKIDFVGIHYHRGQRQERFSTKTERREAIIPQHPPGFRQRAPAFHREVFRRFSCCWSARQAFRHATFRNGDFRVNVFGF